MITTDGGRGKIGKDLKWIELSKSGQLQEMIVIGKTGIDSTATPSDISEERIKRWESRKSFLVR